MATGIKDREKIGEDALIAAVSGDENMLLPQKNVQIELNYSGKASEQYILKPMKSNFATFKNEDFIRVLNISPNSFVLSDNLLAMHNMIKNGVKANLIYADPPYGTGMEFCSRTLEHAYKDIMPTATYIEYMRRRLILMRELLTEDGSLYIHIGYQMLAYMKILMDEIFGANNFRNIITRRKCSSKNYTKNQYVNLNDYILFYSKTNKYTWNQPGTIPDEDWIKKEYPKEDKKGKYKLVPVHAPGIRHGKTGTEWHGMLPPPGKHWQYTPDKLDELDKKGEIHWSKNGNPRRKVYLTKDKMITMTDYWANYRDAHHQSINITGYPTEKNFEMLKMIVQASSNPDDIVIDPFCGSGTTIHAAHELGRKWIGIDQSFIAAKTVLNRLSNGLSPMGDYVLKELTKNKNSNKNNADFNFIIDSSLSEYQDEIIQIIDDANLAF